MRIKLASVFIDKLFNITRFICQRKCPNPNVRIVLISFVLSLAAVHVLVHLVFRKHLSC